MKKHEQDITDTSKEIRKSKQERANAKRKFTRKTIGLQEMMMNNSPVMALKEKFDEVKEAYRHLEHCNELVNSAINENAPHHLIDGLLEECDEYMMQVDRCMDEIRTKFATKTKEENSKLSELRVKPLSAPQFSGNIRQYASFKHDYNRLMTTQFGTDSYALRQCLAGEALDTVKGAEDDFDEIFRRLDAKYGDSRKLVDAVVWDLKKIKPVLEGDNKKFINMVEIVERSWLELKKLNLAQEMNTTSMVTMIEKLLPKTQKREWVTRMDRRQSSETNENSIFEALLSYLQQEKKVIEYMDNDVRGCHVSNAKQINQSTKMNERTIIDMNERTIPDSEDATSFNVDLNPRDGNVVQNDLQQLCNHIQTMTERVGDFFKDQNKQRNESLRKKQITSNENRICWIHKTDSHPIDKCNVFLRYSHEEKLQNLRQCGACFNCLQRGHIAAACPIINQCGQLNKFNQKCGKRHHPCLHIDHQSINKSTDNAVNMTKNKRQETLLAVSHVRCNDQNLSVLWDSGANVSLITHSAASILNLTGDDVELSITKVGNELHAFQSKKYLVPLIDSDEKCWEVHAFGIDEITSELNPVNTSSVAKLFRGIQPQDIKRPYGSIDMLIGIDCCVIMPEVVETVGSLQLLKNQFGYCIRGIHDQYSNSLSSGKNDCQIKGGTLILDVNNIRVEAMTSLKKKLDEYFSVENLGTCCTPRCGGCKCGKCAKGNGNYTLQEERELLLIKDGLHYDSTRNKFTAHYPWIRDPKELPNNVIAAEARLRSTERRLKRMGVKHIEAYKDQMQDMVQRGIARKLSQHELADFEGPVHYLNHHEVIKPESLSTPLRIVFNSSASFMGHVLNDYWAKGPDFINNLFGILLRFREEQIGLVADISKMFNAIQLADMDQHVHRFLWRHMDTKKEPGHFVLTAVAFGDRPSGTIAMVALQEIAEMNRRTYASAADMIVKNSYVDDLIQSVPTVTDAVTLAENVQCVLKKGGFKIKHWIMSGDEDMTAKSKITFSNVDKEKVLGMCWIPKQDHFIFQVKINFSPRNKNLPTGPDLTELNIATELPKTLTRRMVLSQTARIYDPLGFITPVTLKAKLLLRQLVGQSAGEEDGEHVTIGWDDPISEQCRDRWKQFFIDLYKLQDVSFIRCLKPYGAVGEPTLVIFSDASTQAYGACAYVQWEIQNDQYEARLIAAKQRIAPTRQLTMPRLELCGALLGCRLRETITREMKIPFKAIFHIVDSAIVRAQIQKESYGFGTFVATKIAEIQDKSDPREWWWVATADNPADMVSRPTSPTQIGPTSVWQCGPKFLRSSVEKWPIRQDVQDQELPDRIGVHMTSVNVEKQDGKCDIGTVINMDNFGSYTKLLRVTARIMKFKTEKTMIAIGKRLTAQQVIDSETLWVRQVQKNILSLDWRNRFRRLGPSINSNGLIVVGQRMSKWLKDNWNQDSFVLLPADHKFTRLYIEHVHALDHAGLEVTLAKVQRKFWVPGCRKIIKQIKNRCVICRKIEKKVQTQLMGSWVQRDCNRLLPFIIPR